MLPIVITPRFPIQWSWVTLAGPDAKDFLHRITTVDVRQLEIGSGARGCILSPQGKFRAYFILWRYREAEFAFEFDSGATGFWKSQLLEAIDQFTFSEKMTLALPSGDELACRWIFFDQEIESWPKQMQTLALLDEEVRLCNHGRDDFGLAWITAWGRPERLAQWAERAIPESTPMTSTLQSLRISQARPWVDTEITPERNPLELGMVDAIADQKGCYPGQEVIEKIVALGAPSQQLCVIEGEGLPPQQGDELYNLATPPTSVGKMTTCDPAAKGASFKALALIKKIHAKEGMETRIGADLRPSKIIRTTIKTT